MSDGRFVSPSAASYGEDAKELLSLLREVGSLAEDMREVAPYSGLWIALVNDLQQSGVKLSALSARLKLYDSPQPELFAPH